MRVKLKRAFNEIAKGIAGLALAFAFALGLVAAVSIVADIVRERPSIVINPPEPTK